MNIYRTTVDVLLLVVHTGGRAIDMQKVIHCHTAAAAVAKVVVCTRRCVQEEEEGK